MSQRPFNEILVGVAVFAYADRVFSPGWVWHVDPQSVRRAAADEREMPDEKAWLKAADDACYGAKHKGRGRLLFAFRTPDDVIAFKKA